MLKDIEKHELIVVQQVPAAEKFYTNVDLKGRFKILDKDGKLLFQAGEESTLFGRLVMKHFRWMEIQVFTPDGLIQMKAIKPLFKYRFNVYDSNSKEIGEVGRAGSFFSSGFHIKNSAGGIVAEVIHPFNLKDFNKDKEYQIKVFGVQKGKILKIWQGGRKEAYADNDMYRVEFPSGFDSTKKTLVLAMALFIDFYLWRH